MESCQHVNYERYVITIFQDNERESCKLFLQVILTLNLVRRISSPRPISMLIMKAMGQIIINQISGNNCCTSHILKTLTIDLVKPFGLSTDGIPTFAKNAYLLRRRMA